MIEAAKKEGKKAHFAGTHVIIDGKEARPEQIDRSQMVSSYTGTASHT